MSFIDRKEEVIGIELTPYGKYLLSKGKFKPSFYEFFDDDIVYDSNYSGFSELQADIQTRIKETPRSSVQYSFSSAETQMKKNIELVRSGKEKNSFSSKFVPTAEKHYSLSAPLGNSDVASNKSPAWNINFLKGEIERTIQYSTGSHATLQIPQITIKTVTYETFPTKSEVLDSGVSDVNSASKRFKDGSFIQIQDDFVLIDIKEENIPFSNENFDIEVYLIDSDKNDNRRNKEILIPLFFEKKKQQVVNNILIDSDDDIKMTELVGPDFVNHFFNVYVDREINPDTLCKLLSEEEIIALTQSGDFNFNCVKEVASLSDPRIKSDVTIKDIEEC